jgi:hypothetical protein
MLRTPPSEKPTRRPTTKPAAKRKRRVKKKRPPPAQLAPREERERLKPISLYGLDFDDVMRGLLAVKPPQSKPKG